MAYEGRRHDNRGPQRDGPREFFKATCVDCGGECEVPFKPTQGRPVYCQKCYKGHKPEERRPRKHLF
ncbi:MAG: hypothetical protein MJZ38_01575 [archaeon]|nr:hypothetical protein [archaeon]